MITILIVAYLIAYFSVAVVHFAPRFAKECRDRERKRWPSLYRDNHGQFTVDSLNREAVWSGLGQSLFWPIVLACRWIGDRMVDSLTAEERKAADLKEARRIIAEYEAEQLKGYHL